AQHASAHHAVLELLADGVGGVEQTFHAFNQTSVGRRVDGSIARRHHSGVLVQLLLGLQQHQRSRRSGAGSANGVADVLVAVCHISVDAGGQLADTWLEHTLCEIVQLHGQLSGGEVHADVLLAGDSQGGELLVVVLNLQGGTVSHQSAVGQTDTQGRTNLGTFNSKAVVVLTVHVTGDHKVVFKDFQSLACDHVNGKNAIRHDASPLKN
ncbi:MAG: hypothetical protein AN484_25880, partial [Aphanizomenon flos-aquae WA102]